MADDVVRVVTVQKIYYVRDYDGQFDWMDDGGGDSFELFGSVEDALEDIGNRGRITNVEVVN